MENEKHSIAWEAAKEQDPVWATNELELSSGANHRKRDTGRRDPHA